jgi:hypothetical protein
MQTPASQALETGQMSIYRRQDQYKHLFRRLSNQSVYDLFASPTCHLQTRSTDLGVSKRSSPMAVPMKAGAGSRTGSPNASRTSTVR